MGTTSTKDFRCWDGNHVWVTISDMSQMYITNSKRKITDYALQHSSAKLLEKDTVLFSFKLSIGKVAITGVPLCTNEAIAGLVPKDNRVLPKYLYYILPRLDYSSYMQPAAKGKTLNKTILATIKIPLPSTDTQNKLISLMDEKEAIKQEHVKAINNVIQEENQVITNLINQS